MTASPKKPSKKKPAPANFAYAFRSFVGYLEGTEKSLNTIKNYRGDLRSFQTYLEKGLGKDRVELSEVSRVDLEKFHEYLKAQGFKTNTRRRKLLTIRKLLRYLTLRKKISIDVGNRLPAPEKLERIPHIVSADRLIEAIRGLTETSEIQRRNRLLLWTLAETGCLVSEVTRLRIEDFQLGDPPLIALGTKTPRKVPISPELFQAAQSVRREGSSPFLFLGHNKFGPLGAPITPRGVELLVRSHLIQLGFTELTPRTFRHSVVVMWHLAGTPATVIQERLGLRTAYAFRVYDPLFKRLAEASKSNP